MQSEEVPGRTQSAAEYYLLSILGKEIETSLKIRRVGTRLNKVHWGKVKRSHNANLLVFHEGVHNG